MNQLNFFLVGMRRLELNDPPDSIGMRQSRNKKKPVYDEPA
jgi:hypothetical protein